MRTKVSWGQKSKVSWGQKFREDKSLMRTKVSHRQKCPRDKIVLWTEDKYV